MPEQNLISFESENLPGLYQAADTASLNGQSNYNLLLKLNIFFLIIAASVAYLPNQSQENAILSLILFLITICITVWLQVSKPEESWYHGRAVAESVKTRSWRWMMRSNPYGDVEKQKIASKFFIKDLKQILEQNRSLGNLIEAEESVKDPISKKMSDIRKLDWKERSRVYKKSRVDNQAIWYFKKSKLNKKLAGRWFGAMIALYFIAIILLSLTIKDPTLKFPVGIIALCASSILSWLQTKRYKELSTSYALTHQEISIIRGEASYVDSEESLSKFVINSENAFSREHTQWFARKKE